MRGRRKLHAAFAKAVHRLAPLTPRGVLDGDFHGPVADEIDWWPDEKGEVLPWTRIPDLLIELKIVPGGNYWCN